MFATAEDGCKIWYDYIPGEHPVLLIHGFASDSRRNWTLTGWVRALAGRGVLTVDLRGHGQSDKPSTGYSPEGMARDLIAVLDAAELSTVDIVTYSMGGFVGWALARLAPERVGKLVLGGIGVQAATEEAMDHVLEILPGKDLEACIEGMAGSRIEGLPTVPVLLVAGDADDIVPDAAELAARLGAPFVPLPGRNHFTAVTSRVFKQAALDFLEGRK
jgi:pimeloyl-ACP methyl ester carboxylesterase